MSRTEKRIVSKGHKTGARDNFRRVGKLVSDQKKEVYASQEILEAVEEFEYVGSKPCKQEFHVVPDDELKVGAWGHIPPCKQPK